MTRRQALGLAREASAVVFARRQELRQHLDRDGSVEPLVPATVDDTHAALAQPFVDLVAADPAGLGPCVVRASLAVVGQQMLELARRRGGSKI